MPYTFLADLTVLLHLLWIVFLICGVLFAFLGSRLAWLHLGGLVLALILNACGWYCPLTYLENALRKLGAEGGYEVTFITRYVEPVVYPGLPEGVIRIVGIIFICLNLALYAVIARRGLGAFRRRDEKPFA
jgi:hypothetical protein